MSKESIGECSGNSGFLLIISCGNIIFLTRIWFDLAFGNYQNWIQSSRFLLLLSVEHSNLKHVYYRKVIIY